jgi:hypothetical protein
MPWHSSLPRTCKAASHSHRTRVDTGEGWPDEQSSRDGRKVEKVGGGLGKRTRPGVDGPVPFAKASSWWWWWWWACYLDDQERQRGGSRRG